MMSHWVCQSFTQYELSNEVERKLSKYHSVTICFLLIFHQEGWVYHYIHSYTEYNIIYLPLQKARDEREINPFIYLGLPVKQQQKSYLSDNVGFLKFLNKIIKQ